MRKIFGALVVVLALGLSASAHSSQPVPSRLLTLPHREETLANGLRVFLVKYPSPGVVAYELPVRAGSRNEVEKGKTGFAHFFEHLMFRGTKKRTSKQFGDLYTRLGVENNAWTGSEMTNYHGIVATEYLPKILEAEADRFRNLAFDEKALRDEAGAVLGEYNKDVASPDFQLEEKLLATAFERHPYGHTTMGYKDDVLKFTERYKDVWPFFRRYYRPGNVSIVLVGDVDFERALSVIRREFGPWRDPKFEPVEIPAEPEQSAPRMAEVRLAKPTQTRVTVAYKVPAFASRSKDHAAMAVISEVFFSVTSEFQKKFRFDRKWLDHVSAGAQESVDPGLFTVSLRLSEAGEGKDESLRKAIDETIARVRARGPSKDELERTKRRIRALEATGWFSAPEHLASRISWYTRFEPDFEVLDRVDERIAEVTAEDVKAFAAKYLVEARKTTVTLRGAQQ